MTYYSRITKILIGLTSIFGLLSYGHADFLMSNGRLDKVVTEEHVKMYEKAGFHKVCLRRNGCSTNSKAQASKSNQKSNDSDMGKHNAELNGKGAIQGGVHGVPEIDSISTGENSPIATANKGPVHNARPTQPSKEQSLISTLYTGSEEYDSKDKELIEDFMSWADIQTGTPFVLGGRTVNGIDCSGLISVFASKRGVRDYSYTTNTINSTTLSYLGRDKRLDNLVRGDILYWSNASGGINHISVVVENNYPTFTIIDSSYGVGVSKRKITLDNDIYTTVSGGKYKLTGHTNPIVETARKFGYGKTVVDTDSHKQKPVAISEKMYFTHYDLGDVAQNDSTPCIGAAGNDLCSFTQKGGRSIALTADKRKQYGIKFWDKVKLEGDAGCSGIWTVLDEMNCRYRGTEAHRYGTCYNRNGTVTNGNQYRPGTNYLIKGDVAAYGSFQPAGGACYIAAIYKS